MDCGCFLQQKGLSFAKPIIFCTKARQKKQKHPTKVIRVTVVLLYQLRDYRLAAYTSVDYLIQFIDIVP